jgi:hypothetical protein
MLFNLVVYKNGTFKKKVYMNSCTAVRFLKILNFYLVLTWFFSRLIIGGKIEYENVKVINKSNKKLMLNEKLRIDKIKP